MNKDGQKGDGIIIDKKEKSIFMLFCIISLFGLIACDKLDVIGDQSEESFKAIISAIPDKVSEDKDFGGWSLLSLDKEARFVWSKDFSKTTAGDIRLEVRAQPFIEAGLDTTKLPKGMLVGDKIIVGMELGDENLTYVGAASPLDAYKKLVKHYRNNISYHTALDHYGVSLGNGNMFEWAKDMKTNDKDVVFVLNPQPLIDAGVDPNSVEGWVFAKVDMMDESGKKTQVDKFLKPFDVES